MSITLRDAASQLQLRPTATPVDQLALEREQMLGADANPIRQGWVSAGAGMDAYDLLAQANAAERQGDLRSAQALELRAKDHLARAQAWAPTTQKFTDIDGLGSTANWLGGQIGNLRTSVAPMVGGVAGRVAGGLAGGLLAGPPGAAIGANLGGLGGAFVPGYNLEYNESVGQAMLDPEIRAQRTAEEIHRAAQGKGAVAGILESIVPAGVGKLAVEGVGKRAIGKTIAKEMGEEALTEGSQNLVGQAAQNHLRGDPMTQFDYQDAFNDAMAGAVGGGTMAGGGVAIGKARDAMVGGAEKVADIARDPTGAVIDKIKTNAEARGRKDAQDAIAAIDPQQIIDTILKKKAPSVTDALRDDERDMDDATLDRTRHEQAMVDAQEVLAAPAGMYSQAEKDAAAQFQAGQLSWDKVREVRRQGEADRKSIDDANELLRAAGLEDQELRDLEQQGKPETKSSLMRPTLTDNFGEQEGRAMDDDAVTDDFGKVVRRGDSHDMRLPSDERGFGSTVRRVEALQSKYSKEATKADAQRTVTVADVLVSGGYWPKEIVDAAKSATQKEGMLTTASTLLTWMKYGMQDKRYEKDDSLVEALVGKYGDKAVGMLDKAYEVGVNSGLVERDDAKFAERKEQAVKSLADSKNLGDVVMKYLDPALKAQVSLKDEDAGTADFAELVGKIRRIASTGGTAAEQRVMEILFPNAENRHEVQKALYTPSISKKAFGTESNVTRIGREQGETSRAGKVSRSVEDLDSEDYEHQVDALSGESDEGGETSEARGSKYIHAPGGHAFRKRDAGSRAAMKAAKEKHAGTGVRVEEVGVVDATLDKARIAAGGQLSTDQRHQVLEKLARRYLRREMPPRPATPPEDASALTKSVHKQDLQKWQAKLERLSRALNRTHVVLKSSAVDEEKTGELDYEAVRAAQLDRKLDDPRNRPEEGVLWVGTKRGAKMLISAPQILRLAFRSGEAHQDVGFSGKTKEGDEITVGFGSPQNIYNMLLRSLGDITLMPEFNGTWGFVEAGGTPVQVAGKHTLPDNFTLLKKTPKRDALTIADVERAKTDYDRRISALKDGDADPDSFGGRVKKLRPVGQMWSMLKNDDLKNPADAPRLEKFLTALEAGKFNKVQAGKLIRQWKEYFGITGKTTEYLDGMPMSDGRAVDGLAAYEPEKQIVRGDQDHGFVTTSNIGVAAQSVIGTTKAVDAAGAKSLSGPTPTKPLTPEERFAMSKVGAVNTKSRMTPKLMDLIKHLFENTKLGVRGLTKDEVSFVSASLRELSARSEKFAEFAAQIAHFYAFGAKRKVTDDQGDVVEVGGSEHSALYQGDFGQGLGGVIGMNVNVFTDLRQHLFQNIGAQVRYIMAHEVGHAVDIGPDKATPGTLSTDPAFEMGENGAIGAVAVEMYEAANDKKNPFSTLLRHPPFKKEYDGRPQAAQRELFAQAFAMYAENKEAMREALPLTHAHMEKIYEAENSVQPSTRVDTGATKEQRPGLASVQKGNNAGAGQGTGVQGAGGRLVRNEPADAGRARLLAQLKTLKPKNTIHKRAVENLAALLEGKKEGNIAKAMNDMVRWDQTLGELSVRQREQLKAWVEKRGEPAEEQVPIEAYDELAYDPEQAEYDRDAYEGETRNSLMRTENNERETETDSEGVGRGGDAESAIVDGSGLAAKIKEQGRRFGDFAKRRINRVSQAFSFQHWAEKLKHNEAVGPFSSYETVGLYDQKGGTFTMFVLPEHTGDLVRDGLQQAKAAGMKLDNETILRILGNISTLRIGLTGDNELAILASQPGTYGAKLLESKGAYSTTTDKFGRTLGRMEGVTFQQNVRLLGEFHARMKNANGGEAVEINWDRFTGANLGKKGSGAFSKQQAGEQQATPEQMAKVEAELHRILGNDVKVLFEDLGGKSGEWTRDDTAAVIRLAVNGDIMATGFHEAIHQLFSLLKQHRGQEVVNALQRIATSPVMQGRLRKLLKDHPEAMAQLSDPEEAVAYMFQFWMMDQSGFKLGPEAKTLFQKIKRMLDKAFALLSKTVRDRLVGEQRSEKDAMMAEYLMSQLAAGKMADKTGRAAVVEALNKDAEKHNAALNHLGDSYTKLITGVGRVFATAEGLLESYNIPYLTMLARQMHQRAGEAMGDKAGYLEAVRFVSNHYEAKINAILANHSKDDLELARAWLVQHPDKAHPSPEVNEVVGKIQGFLKEMRGYIEKMGIRRLEGGEWVAIDFRKHYFPHVWDTAAVSENMEQFVLDLMDEHGDKLEAIAKEAGVSVEEVAQTILKRVMNPNAQVDLEETASDLGMTPAATAINRRSLDWLNMEVFDKYMSKDLGQILHSYTHNIVQRGEYQSRFGYGGEKLKETVDNALLYKMGGESLIARAAVAMPEYERQWAERKAAAEADGREFSEPYPTLRSVGTDLFKKDEGAEADTKIGEAMKALEPAFKTIMAMEGTLGNDISPGLRKAENWITTYQNFRVLAPGLFSSFMDIMGVVREGGEFKDAWGAFVAGIKEAKNIMQDKRDDSYMMQRAELFGSADAGSFSSAVGQHSTSVYMSGKAKEWSDKLFKYNGMEGWNRGVRAYATLVAERILLDWAKNGINSKDPAEVARVERLFGKGFDVSNIKLDENGNVDATDPKNIAAVNRWVHDAVIAPNAAHRPYWMSDPHFQIVAHLKSFSYSAHAVMLKQVAAQARLGNYRPALVTLLGYAPIAIAAGAIKEMLIPGDEPPWMKGGLDGYLEYGWDRAGVLGIPQMYAQNLFDSDPVAAFGPTANQVQDLLTVPLGELKVGPVGWRDHRTFEEMMGAAPFGSVLRRYGADVDDWIAK